MVRKMFKWLQQPICVGNGLDLQKPVDNIEL